MEIVVKDEFIFWLQREYRSRRSRNARFSIRSFAKQIAIDPSSLSQIMAGKRNVSNEMAAKITGRIGITPLDREIVFSDSQQNGNLKNETEYKQIEFDKYLLIAEWYHFAILELTSVTAFQSNEEWIANQLNLPLRTVKDAIQRLERLGFLNTLGLKWKKTHAFMTNEGPQKTSSPQKILQRQIIQMAGEAIDGYEPHEKDITSITFAIDESKIEDAKKLIKQFRRKMAALLEQGQQTRVYHLGVQLYPVSNSNIKPTKR